MIPDDLVRNAKNHRRPETFNEFILRAHEDGWDEVSRLSILRARINRGLERFADAWNDAFLNSGEPR